MEIVLEYLSPENWPRPKGWTVVGRVATLGLAYDPAKQPYLIGEGEPQPLDPVNVCARSRPSLRASGMAAYPRQLPLTREIQFGA
ncbi:hypothetical protein [Methylorubrum extorquens]|uniref:Uncharacterized protein n=1 Tax=Methylorubrum extorquens (strain CM4 / NCIMB 13688) TaxID=440085 RepID=B7L1V2_METC4|nr:hypothetical protein [Methylorubrum extorquens]ACK81496.1 hypothetical protein Mchl_0574 [Methylorubrum extorquens CM4]